MVNVLDSDLDLEWAELLLEAKNLGITDDEIRKFFEQVQQEKVLTESKN